MCNNTAVDAAGKACCSAQHYADPLDARCYTTPAQVSCVAWLGGNPILCVADDALLHTAPHAMQKRGTLMTLTTQMARTAKRHRLGILGRSAGVVVLRSATPSARCRVASASSVSWMGSQTSGARPWPTTCGGTPSPAGSWGRGATTRRRLSARGGCGGWPRTCGPCLLMLTCTRACQHPAPTFAVQTLCSRVRVTAL